jgi:hypothetical protein
MCSGRTLKLLMRIYGGQALSGQTTVNRHSQLLKKVDYILAKALSYLGVSGNVPFNRCSPEMRDRWPGYAPIGEPRVCDKHGELVSINQVPVDHKGRVIDTKKNPCLQLLCVTRFSLVGQLLEKDRARRF